MNKAIKLNFLSISIGIISMFSNIFISEFVFSALGMLTGMIVILGLRLIGKDIYKFIDNYKIKNFNYLSILFFCLYVLLCVIVGALIGFLENYFLFSSSENTIIFINSLLLSQFIIIHSRLKGIDLYK